ncbi:type IV secretory system conjugative DNA transfer family protein [Streptomyces hydrogenans]|uniref:type IV secretory system conjugative DNA transfer family protein n=1 Tax=Streptomyces hydrogenans TaxID=1873719 RepID=UPI0036E35449
MTTPTDPTSTPAPQSAPAAGASTTERTVALTTSAAPIITGIAAPLLADNAVFIATVTYGGIGGFLAANFMNRLPDHLLAQIPGADIIRAHRAPLFASTLTTGMALAVGTLGGPLYSDALLAGITTLPSVPGILSLGWWAGVALAPLQLRRVLRRPRKTTPTTPPTHNAPATYAPVPQLVPFTTADEILMLWGRHISDPATGSHKAQELAHLTVTADRWTGTITAPLGTSVNVTREKVSSVYQVNVGWIDLRPGAHAGQQHITVHRTPPATLDPTTLAGAWAKHVARPGGVLAHTHLEDIQDDPNTGGKVARVVAGDELDKLPLPDRASLAGALRTTPLLVSYEPLQNPREAYIRIMDRNPLQDGVEFPGTDVLKPNPQGYIRLGRGISGFPARIQLFDPALGAQHVLIAGVTGSGKGGTLQLIALAHHLAGSAIIYADPKGSSNPTIELMAAYSGLGNDASLGALRIWYALLLHRVAESARLGMKNFKPSPDRPYIPLIFDEASSHLGEKAEHRKEAVFIIKEGARLGRSLGMPVILANQILQLDAIGGAAAIRDNLFYGGSLILLRSDSQQKTLIDLPENFAGCNPADIPAAWSEDRAMVYDPNIPDNDPRRTFGLGFAASPGAHAEMMRNWLLEDATPYIDQNAVAHPADWPDWDRRDEIAATPVIDDGTPFELDSPDGGADGGLPPSVFTMTKKPETAAEKILDALARFGDPTGTETVYANKAQLEAVTGLTESTLNNTLGQLVRKGKAHRKVDENGAEIRGLFGLGPTPNTVTPDDSTHDGLDADSD